MNTMSDAELNAVVETIVDRILHGGQAPLVSPPQPVPQQSSKTVAIGTDHGGLKMKQMLVSHLAGSRVPGAGLWYEFHRSR